MTSHKKIRKAVILAGGLGNRLRPLTNIIPKPLLPIGESTVLDIQLLSLKKHGVDTVYIATNYMSEAFASISAESEKFGLKVVISKEEKPLGTCGPLSLLSDELDEPFFMMNGDILTDLDFGELGKFALGQPSELTVVTKEINIPFRFGKVVCEGDFIKSVEEKPNYKQEILAGIYALAPSITSYIPEDEYYGIDDLIKHMLDREIPVSKYLTTEYWIDIGQLEDYEIAKNDYASHQTTGIAPSR